MSQASTPETKILLFVGDPDSGKTLLSETLAKGQTFIYCGIQLSTIESDLGCLKSLVDLAEAGARFGLGFSVVATTRDVRTVPHIKGRFPGSVLAWRILPILGLEGGAAV